MNDKFNLAALDIGTNSFHLIVVSVSENGDFEIIDREREVIRLSEGNVGDIKTILPESIDRAVSAISRFNKIAESHNAKLRATATSAVRESNNKKEFLDIVKEKTGVSIEVISGLEEARLIYFGILKAVPIYGSISLSIDIGGGSTEFIIGDRGKILYSNSLKLGAVRLTQRFFPDFILTDDKIAIARKWVEGVISPIIKRVENERIDVFVGSSGTFLNIGMMINALSGDKNISQTMNNFEFSLEEFEEIEQEVLTRKTPAERKSIPGLEEKRIDIIPAGIIIVSTLFKLLKIKKIKVSDYALREGIILDSMDKLGICEGRNKLHDIRFESIKQLASSSQYDSEHCNNVSKLAVKLFDYIQSLHNLNESAREYLEAASILHDIGYHISHAQHHKHSYYIIRNSELLGLNDSEIEIIANVARYHRKSHPKKSHDDFTKLSKENQNIVLKLSAILRVADAFDRTHNNFIKDFDISINGDSVEILIKTDENIEVELWSLERRKELFEEIFGKELVIKN
ncbi:MAG: Ppx/GppA phosphatase family protein [Bacteroidota bacterium]